MPYKLEKVGGRYFVADDKGKKYSEKPMSKKRAMDQMRALYASEKKEVSLDKKVDDIRASVMRILQPISGMPQATLANDVWIREVYEKYVIANFSGKTYRIDYKLDKDGNVSLSDPVEVENTWKPVGKAIYINEKAIPLKGGDPASSFRVFKQADGLYRWVTISSSAFKDRDGEIVTEKALAEDCIRCDNVKEYGPLRWWHLGGYEAPDGIEKWETWKAGSGIDIGTCDFNMLHGKMLLESGTFKTAELGQAFADSQEKLEVSIAFSHPPSESKEYNNIHRFERSLLPEGMASNLLTKYYVVKGEASMKTTEKLAALVAILRGKPEAAKQILTDAEAIQKAAEVAGLEYKEVEDLIKGEDEALETSESSATEEVVDNTPVVDENAAEAAVEVVAEKEAEEPDEIGDMSHEQLKQFVVDIMKQMMPAEKPAAKEIDLSGLAEKEKVAALETELTTLKEQAAANKQILDELTDSRPVGIKQLQSRRPTESKDNITIKEVVGPHIDDSFMSFAQGGK